MAYDKHLYELADNEIKHRRLSAENALNTRISEVEDKLPEIAEIRRQLAGTSVELTKIIIRRDKNFQNCFEKIRNQNLQGHEMIRSLLKKGGYPENYLEPSYTCPICRDTGIDKDSRCRCFDKLLNDLAVQKLNEEANMPDCDFEHFKL